MWGGARVTSSGGLRPEGTDIATALSRISLDPFPGQAHEEAEVGLLLQQVESSGTGHHRGQLERPRGICKENYPGRSRPPALPEAQGRVCGNFSASQALPCLSFLYLSERGFGNQVGRGQSSQV